MSTYVPAPLISIWRNKNIEAPEILRENWITYTLYFYEFTGGSYPEPPNQSDNGLQFLKFENVGEWFEYLWSTTRAIRKDITQQDLKTDPMAVDLVEKIARFHIMCAERLVEEESYNFDKKLNDENLTKCIQTLKHMYYDMSIEGRVSKLMEFQGNI